jgi:hypothetical protein
MICVKNELQFRGVTLDLVIQLVRLAEAFVVGSEYAEALGYKTGTQLRFGIWWTGLTGRNLSSWSNSWYDFFWAKPSHDSEVHSEITLLMGAPAVEVIQKTTEAIQKLARSFGGFIFPEAIVQKEVNSLLVHLPS